jgi:hypothetical protein
MNKNQRLRILLTALIFVVAFYRYRPEDAPLAPCGLGFEPLTLGCSLASTGTFSSPFAVLPTGPTAHLAPLFPWIVSLVVKRFGNEPVAMRTLEWLAALMLAFQISLWPWISKRMGMGFATGMIAAALWLPVGFVLDPEWEAPYVALLILILVFCMYRILKVQVSTAFVSMSGMLWGILFLFSPVPLLSCLAITIWAVVASPIRRVQKLALVIIPFAVISPWLIRNYEVFHHFILIRDNLGLELSISNSPCSTFSFNLSKSRNCYIHPNESLDEARKVAASGEYEYNREKLRDAVGWVESNPGRFALLAKQRFLAYWFFSPTGIFFDGRHLPLGILILWTVTPLSLGGLWLLFRKDPTAAGLCLIWMLLFPPIHYITLFLPRYRFPLLWVSFIPASFFLIEVGEMVLLRLRKTYGLSAAPVDSAAKPVI